MSQDTPRARIVILTISKTIIESLHLSLSHFKWILIEIKSLFQLQGLEYARIATGYPRLCTENCHWNIRVWISYYNTVRVKKEQLQNAGPLWTTCFTCVKTFWRTKIVHQFVPNPPTRRIHVVTQSRHSSRSHKQSPLSGCCLACQR